MTKNGGICGFSSVLSHIFFENLTKNSQRVTTVFNNCQKLCHISVQKYDKEYDKKYGKKYDNKFDKKYDKKYNNRGAGTSVMFTGLVNCRNIWKKLLFLNKIQLFITILIPQKSVTAWEYFRD